VFLLYLNAHLISQFLLKDTAAILVIMSSVICWRSRTLTATDLYYLSERAVVDEHDSWVTVELLRWQQRSTLHSLERTQLAADAGRGRAIPAQCLKHTPARSGGSTGTLALRQHSICVEQFEQSKSSARCTSSDQPIIPIGFVYASVYKSAIILLIKITFFSKRYSDNSVVQWLPQM